MLFRILIYFLGILLISIGIFLTILDVNVLTVGYNFLEFVKFIIRRRELWFILIGLILVVLAIGGKKIHELLLRHSTKLE